MMLHKYTRAEEDYIRMIAPGRSWKEITEMVNTKFGTDLSVGQISSFMQRKHIVTGLTGRFERGNVPKTKGMKGIHRSPATEFRKDHIPSNCVPVGTEVMNSDGYLQVKIAEPNKWKCKHRLVWEAANGPIPKGHVLIFADKNSLNVSLDNLLLVTRAELLRLNRNGLLFTDKELSKIGVSIAKVIVKTHEREKNVNG